MWLYQANICNVSAWSAHYNYLTNYYVKFYQLLYNLLLSASDNNNTSQKNTDIAFISHLNLSDTFIKKKFNKFHSHFFFFFFFLWLYQSNICNVSAWSAHYNYLTNYYVKFYQLLYNLLLSASDNNNTSQKNTDIAFISHLNLSDTSIKKKCNKFHSQFFFFVALSS